MSGLQAPDEHSGELAVDRVFHRYARGGLPTEVLRDVSFSVAPGHVACVVGPSGCGKSTLLSLAAGLLRPSSGTLRWDGAQVAIGSNPDLGMAFQQPGLFPWMTVRQNVAIGLRTRGHKRHDARRIADEFLATVGLAEFKDAYPSQLSGGMAQRVGIARVCVLLAVNAVSDALRHEQARTASVPREFMTSVRASYRIAQDRRGAVPMASNVTAVLP
jgi:ABC-type nitrate/sulfonate/bicarbonate transport system ATPase subunit